MAAGYRLSSPRPIPSWFSGALELTTMDDAEREASCRDFDSVVNMSAKELEDWLRTADSQSVGWTHEGEDESVGHRSGRCIVQIKRARKADLTDDDYAHMRKVVGYVQRHLAQGGPEHDQAGSRWRYSLMNWGHDPLK